MSNPCNPCNSWFRPLIRVYSCEFVVNFRRANARDLLQERFMNITKNLGMLLLAIYLILIGIIALVHIGIPPIVTGILALAAGILILIGR
jgi:predicted membrane protein